MPPREDPSESGRAPPFSFTADILSAAETLRNVLSSNPSASSTNLFERAQVAVTNVVIDRYKAYVQQLRENAPTVLLVGDSGLGKSSLINIIFNLQLGITDQFAAVSHGEPCTDSFNVFGPTDTAPVRIIDSKGVEKLTVASQINEVMAFIIERSKSRNILNHVHLVYYFVGLNRWQDADRECLRRLQQHCGVVLVINKCDIRSDDEVRALREAIRRDFHDIDIAECGDPRGTRNWIPKECPNGHGDEFLEVNLRKRTWRCEYSGAFDADGEPIPCGAHGDDSPFGHKALVRMSLELLPQLVRASFRNAQRVDLASRHIQAATVIVAATSTAAGVGYIPVPFPDLPLLLAIEAGMTASLMAVYGADLETFTMSTLATLNSGVIGVGAFLGYFSAKALKTIPGVGTVVGATIDMSVAASTVLTLGVSMAAVLSSAMEENGASWDANEFSKRCEEVVSGLNLIKIAQQILSNRLSRRRKSQDDAPDGKVLEDVAKLISDSVPPPGGLNNSSSCSQRRQQ